MCVRVISASMKDNTHVSALGIEAMKEVAVGSEVDANVKRRLSRSAGGRRGGSRRSRSAAPRG